MSHVIAMGNFVPDDARDTYLGATLRTRSFTEHKDFRRPAYEVIRADFGHELRAKSEISIRSRAQDDFTMKSYEWDKRSCKVKMEWVYDLRQNHQISIDVKEQDAKFVEASGLQPKMLKRVIDTLEKDNIILEKRLVTYWVKADGSLPTVHLENNTYWELPQCLAPQKRSTPRKQAVEVDAAVDNETDNDDKQQEDSESIDESDIAGPKPFGASVAAMAESLAESEKRDGEIDLTEEKSPEGETTGARDDGEASAASDEATGEITHELEPPNQPALKDVEADPTLKERSWFSPITGQRLGSAYPFPQRGQYDKFCRYTGHPLPYHAHNGMARTLSEYIDLLVASGRSPDLLSTLRSMQGTQEEHAQITYPFPDVVDEYTPYTPEMPEMPPPVKRSKCV
jgi:hypothetical protein